MRLFLTSLIWYLNYLCFKIFLFGNRRVLCRFEHRLFKVLPLKPVRPIDSRVAIEIVAEYEIPVRRSRASYMLQYARCDKTYAGDRNAVNDDHVVVPVRIFCPVKATKILVTGKYEIFDGRGQHYVDQEYMNVEPGWFDGILYVPLYNKEKRK